MSPLVVAAANRAANVPFRFVGDPDERIEVVARAVISFWAVC